jgi:hypothetical protein
MFKLSPHVLSHDVLLQNGPCDKTSCDKIKIHRSQGGWLAKINQDRDKNAL